MGTGITDCVGTDKRLGVGTVLGYGRGETVSGVGHHNAVLRVTDLMGQR